MDRAQRLKDKEDKQRYFEERLEETEEKNTELAERLESLKTVLDYTLSVDDTISFESLRIQERFVPTPVPHDLATSKPSPHKQAYLSRVKAPGLLEKALGLKKRYERERAAAEAQYTAAQKAHAESEREREARLAEFSWVRK